MDGGVGSLCLIPPIGLLLISRVLAIPTVVDKQTWPQVLGTKLRKKR